MSPRLLGRVVAVTVWLATGLLYLLAMSAGYTTVVEYGNAIATGNGPWWGMISDITFIASVAIPAVWFLAPIAYWLFGGIVEEANEEVIYP